MCLLSNETFFNQIGIDASERLRRLKKEQLISVLSKVIKKKRRDDLINIILEKSSFKDFLENSPSTIRNNLLFEPRQEREMKTAVGGWLKEFGWKIREEIPITKDSVADIVGFGKREKILSEEKLICAVELKRAKASKSDIDRGFRQINDYLRGADYVYLAVTPLLLWQKGLDFFIRRLQPLNAGLIIADGQKVLTEYMAPEKSKYIDSSTWGEVWKYNK